MRACRCAHVATHFLHRLHFDLPDALGGHAKLRGQIVQRGLIFLLEPARFDNAAAARIETCQSAGQPFTALLLFLRVEPGYDLEYHVVDREPLIVLMPSDHRLTARSSVSPQALVGEIFIGVLIGGMARLVTSALQIAGNIIGMQTGLSFAQNFDPTQGIQGALVGTLLSVIAITMITRR